MAGHVRNGMSANLLDIHADENRSNEALWVRVKLSSNGYAVVGVIYRSLAGAPSGLLDFMVLWTVDGHCLVLGDVNAPRVDWGPGCFTPAADKSLFSC